MKKKYSIGMDYGSNSVRALVVDITNGNELGTGVFNYEKGEAGILLDKRNPLVARQSPYDYLKGLEVSILKALKEADKVKGFKRKDVIGIGVDTTGSTPIPVDESGTPLAFKPDFKNDLNAQAWLWKDHSSVNEAKEITELAKKRNEPYLFKCGGIYSSEWFFSKILHCLRIDPEIFEAAYSWVELCDYVPGVLTGNNNLNYLKRSICAAGHKAMFNPDWGGLPSREFLKELDPKMADLRDRLFDKAYTSDTKLGNISEEYAKMFSLNEDVSVSVGAFDAHMGAVGAGIKPGRLVKIIGTSTCDMMVVPESNKLADVPGVCGIVNGSILPHYFGLEAGQSAVGDIFNWFVTNFASNEYFKKTKKENIFDLLTEKAEKYNPGETGLLALDWNNGNRTILVDAKLTGLLVGQTLYTKPEEVYRALIEATAFGARVIIDRFEEYGVKVEEVVNCGGIAEKNVLLMQIYADILNRPMKISKSSQTCALGASIFGAVAAGTQNGGYSNVEEAQENMCALKNVVYDPEPKSNSVYEKILKIYKKLHDAFGTPACPSDLNMVMKDLLEIKAQASESK